jgi:hypothetical protein
VAPNVFVPTQQNDSQGSDILSARRIQPHNCILQNQDKKKSMGSRRRHPAQQGSCAADEDEEVNHEILDEEEQAAVIQDLRRKNEDQNRLTRVNY